jgi:hypothetical protein
VRFEIEQTDGKVIDAVDYRPAVHVRIVDECNLGQLADFFAVNVKKGAVCIENTSPNTDEVRYR